MSRRSNLDIIKDYFPGKWRWLASAHYWSGHVHTSRDVPQALIKVFVQKNPLELEAYRKTWIITCGDVRVEAHQLHDALAVMHKRLYSIE